MQEPSPYADAGAVPAHRNGLVCAVLPEVEKLLRQHGFAVEVRDMGFKRMWSAARLVIATRGASG